MLFNSICSAVTPCACRDFKVHVAVMFFVAKDVGTMKCSLFSSTRHAMPATRLHGTPSSIESVPRRRGHRARSVDSVIWLTTRSVTGTSRNPAASV